MNLSQQLAKHFRDVHYGGNWTAVTLKEQLSDITWEEATTKVDSLNTILALVYHINYYVSVQLEVLKGKPLNAHDKFSFDHPSVNSAGDWDKLLNKVWTDADDLIGLVEQFPESKLWENFTDSKYGTYYRNLAGMIEHTHYHLGQITIIKKLIREKKD